MTISKITANEVAERIIKRVKASGCTNPDALALGLVEDVMTIRGNASFNTSLTLIYKAIAARLFHQTIKGE